MKGGFLTKELPGIPIQIEMETQEQVPGMESYQEKIVTRPAGLFRREAFRMETRTRPCRVTRKEILNKTIEVIRDEWVQPIGVQPGCAWDFCLLPAGSFARGDKGRQHQVTLTRDFYLGRHPVTQRQWEPVMGNNPSVFKGEDKPVERVSWEDVQQYIQKLNERAGEARYRLPTEAEWEYACRAGSSGKYCFGDHETMLGEYAWYEKNSDRQTHPVGLKKANDWGLYDMHGNVWEWVQDWYGDYPAASLTDPEGPSSGSARVYRGGSWFNPAKGCRSAARDLYDPGLRSGHLGFRLLRIR
jgi:formylglycine-generating enzyme required for sulfatase activity